MKQIKRFCYQFWTDEAGQGFVEYMLILVIIGLIFTQFKAGITGLFTKMMENLTKTLNSATGPG